MEILYRGLVLKNVSMAMRIWNGLRHKLPVAFELLVQSNGFKTAFDAPRSLLALSPGALAEACLIRVISAVGGTSLNSRCTDLARFCVRFWERIVMR